MANPRPMKGRGGALSITPAFEVTRTEQMYSPETTVLVLENRL